MRIVSILSVLVIITATLVGQGSYVSVTPPVTVEGTQVTVNVDAPGHENKLVLVDVYYSYGDTKPSGPPDETIYVYVGGDGKGSRLWYTPLGLIPDNETYTFIGLVVRGEPWKNSTPLTLTK